MVKRTITIIIITTITTITIITIIIIIERKTILPQKPIDS